MTNLSAFILSLIVLAPNHELVRHPELRAEVAGYFMLAGEKYNLEPSLLAYWAWRESWFQVDAVGTRGEIGYAQAHGKALKTCIAAGLDIKTREGGAHCIGLLLDMGMRMCGGLERGARWYASGSCRGSVRTKKKIKDRLHSWRRKWNILVRRRND